MSRILIVSNRLPLQIKVNNQKLDITPSIGGLATGLKSVHTSHNSKWIGWTGLVNEEIDDTIRPAIDQAMKENECIEVPLNEADHELFYYGFSNKTLWPLFHYFTQYAEFKKETWTKYRKVNQKFADIVIENAEKGDKIWIQDYQLMLLPQMIKEKRPDLSIGFFLHIPFPSFEVFRILPWRKELLEGVLGADLIGFHTYDYERHFFSTVRRILGYDIYFNQINLPDRIVVVDSFPMGIDFDKFYNAAQENKYRAIKDKTTVQRELEKYLLDNPKVKLILSIDRLDYTKGIANRLNAFEYFLNKYPEFKGKVTLIMLAVPSRANVSEYKKMKSEVDELVGRINGEFSTIDWVPVWYFYRSMPFENLIDLYVSSEIALLTPIRDGMNLVAKEYVASQIDKKGVLILSEMAGAAHEMSEALVINPNNYDEIADNIKDAILMPEEEQMVRNNIMQERLKRYNVKKWAGDFINALNEVHKVQDQFVSKKINDRLEKQIVDQFKCSLKRILFLDYDGTLVGFKNKPEDARPDAELYNLLDQLAVNRKTEIVLISGRDKETLAKWFDNKKYTLIAEHGVWIKKPDKDWRLIEQMNVEWKLTIRSVIDMYVDRTPGSFIEEKNYSLVWHYRKADPELGIKRANELKDELTSLVANHNLEILEGKKVIEVKNIGVNKGRAAVQRLGSRKYDCIMGIGDDWTDEYLFERLPEEAVTIKVGLGNTKATYNIDSFLKVRQLLRKLANC